MAEKRLYEISVLRPLLILSIVVGHCFAIYSGSWKTPEWLQQYPIAYSYVNPFFISFQLAAFTFISGYLMGYKKYRIDVNFFVKKIRRLYIPAIVFGILYLILFKKADIHGFLPFSLAVLKGVGHLWFLPMLFWCFVFVGLIESLNISWKWVLPFFLLLLFVKGTAQRYFPHLGIANSFSYLFYFYLGLLCKRYNWMHRYENLKQTTGMIAFVLFLLLFAFQIIVLEPLQIDSFLKGKISDVATLMICLCGIFFSLQFAKVSTNNPKANFVQRMEWLGQYCFPIYVYHQFLILLLYYTIPPTFLPTNIIPIVVCIIVILLSLALSYVTLHTRMGRLIFG